MTERRGGASFAGLGSRRRKGKKAERQKQKLNDLMKDRLNTDDQATSCVSGFLLKFILAVPKTHALTCWTTSLHSIRSFILFEPHTSVNVS